MHVQNIQPAGCIHGYYEHTMLYDPRFVCMHTNIQTAALLRYVIHKSLQRVDAYIFIKILAPQSMQHRCMRSLQFLIYEYFPIQCVNILQNFYHDYHHCDM